MGITLLVGGARSGKSARALRLASDWDGQVVFVATAEDRDSEMAARIARHRLERPASWRTIEAPLELVRAFDSIPAGAFVILDCLTLWVANALEAGWTDEDVERAAVAVATIAAGREAPRWWSRTRSGSASCPRLRSGAPTATCSGGSTPSSPPRRSTRT